MFIFLSTGAQWHHARKLITPAFHFKILEEFAEVMISKAAILTECIEREIKIHGDKPFDIFQLCVRAALDIICGVTLVFIHFSIILVIHTAILLFACNKLMTTI